MVPADSRRIPRDPRYSGSHARQAHCGYGAVTLSGRTFQSAPLRCLHSTIVLLLPRTCIATHTVWALPRSLATTKGITDLFSLPPGTKMFQFPGLASIDFTMDSRPSRLIAAYHVLHRLREPRHPPCALFCFAVLRPAMIIKPRRELILSAVVFHAPRHCRDATKVATAARGAKFSTVLIVTTCQRSTYTGTSCLAWCTKWRITDSNR